MTSNMERGTFLTFSRKPREALGADIHTIYKRARLPEKIRTIRKFNEFLHVPTAMAKELPGCLTVTHALLSQA